MISRRRFLGLAGAVPVLFVYAPGATSRAVTEQGSPRIGLALGSGGARGLAHILVLEMLDELGVRPAGLAGSSIGSVIGALYAAGRSGRAIRELFDRLLINEADDWRDILGRKDLLRWFDFLDLDIGQGGLVGPESFLDYLVETMEAATFEDLDIPLQIVAADLWTGRPVVFDRGDLRRAIAASIAMPGLFPPIRDQGNYLVDGGIANPVPYDLLLDRYDIVIAVDVLGERVPNEAEAPSMAQTIFASFNNMQRSILSAKLADRSPDILIQPDLRDVRVLEFYRAEDIYRQAEPSIGPARDRLQALLSARAVR
ncbi:patatin-like phospholipase family protein [Thioalkalicoccus limnaeus]|uniref:Patatin-like phospholipase family protein n=1 Tax=Thioalkalicoccus limnaeus TaxID=120681 RepID=A0ABV4BAQ2_9GAMM